MSVTFQDVHFMRVSGMECQWSDFGESFDDEKKDGFFSSFQAESWRGDGVRARGGAFLLTTNFSILVPPIFNVNFSLRKIVPLASNRFFFTLLAALNSECYPDFHSILLHYHLRHEKEC